MLICSLCWWWAFITEKIRLWRNPLVTLTGTLQEVFVEAIILVCLKQRINHKVTKLWFVISLSRSIVVTQRKCWSPLELWLCQNNVMVVNVFINCILKLLFFSNRTFWNHYINRINVSFFCSPKKKKRIQDFLSRRSSYSFNLLPLYTTSLTKFTYVW